MGVGSLLVLTLRTESRPVMRLTRWYNSTPRGAGARPTATGSSSFCFSDTSSAGSPSSSSSSTRASTWSSTLRGADTPCPRFKGHDRRIAEGL